MRCGESIDPSTKKEFLGLWGTNTAYPQIAGSNSVDKSGFSSWIKRFEHWLFSAHFLRQVEAFRVGSALALDGCADA